jgi:YVTN family beta-propeller protein
VSVGPVSRPRSVDPAGKDLFAQDVGVAGVLSELSQYLQVQCPHGAMASAVDDCVEVPGGHRAPRRFTSPAMSGLHRNDGVVFRQREGLGRRGRNADLGVGAPADRPVDPVTNQVIGQVDLPAPVFFATVQPETVFFASWETAEAAVVDRATWTVTSTLDIGRPTAGGTLATDGTSIYVPAAGSQEVVVVDASTFTVVDTIEPIDPWSVAIEGGRLWSVEEGGAVAQRFDL